MNIKVVLFDLDGTLLPMENSDLFVKTYFESLAKKLAPLGYDPDHLVKSVWQGTKAMMTNPGEKTNEQLFWDTFASIYGENARNHICHFEEYYKTDFDIVQTVCGFNEKAKMVVDEIKKMELRVALATNPLFPSVATEKRIKWAGLDPQDFELYTTYENHRYSKPHTNYYLEVTKLLNVKPEECLMVGNDATEDMVAEELGMKVFLLTDCILNKKNKDISSYPQGSFDDLLKYIKEEILK